MWFGIVSLLPEMFEAVSNYGVVGKAFKDGKVSLCLFNPRDYTSDRHRTVDDRPYGGGPGMLMKVEPLKKAIQSAKAEAANLRGQGTYTKAKTVYLSPQGRKLDHRLVAELAQESQLILVAGRYEGVDERLIESEIDIEISLGDFVLSGGEIPAMALMDAIARQVPNVLGHAESAEQDSFVEGLLDCPHYTRPEDFEGKCVPEVLLGGNHEEIRRWRLKQSLGRTWQRRPDLLNVETLGEEAKALLDEFIKEAKG